MFRRPTLAMIAVLASTDAFSAGFEIPLVGSWRPRARRGTFPIDLWLSLRVATPFPGEIVSAEVAFTRAPVEEKLLRAVLSRRDAAGYVPYETFANWEPVTLKPLLASGRTLGPAPLPGQPMGVHWSLHPRLLGRHFAVEPGFVYAPRMVDDMPEVGFKGAVIFDREFDARFRYSERGEHQMWLEIYQHDPALEQLRAARATEISAAAEQEAAALARAARSTPHLYERRVHPELTGPARALETYSRTERGRLAPLMVEELTRLAGGEMQAAALSGYSLQSLRSWKSGTVPQLKAFGELQAAIQRLRGR